MKWITREHPKIDRLACPWLIRRFVDRDAEFFFSPPASVKTRARDLNAIPFDVPGVELSHRGDRCTFDTLIEKYSIDDPHVAIMAPIVRGADTDRHDLAAQAAGLWAISAGLAHNTPDDQELLAKGMLIYDALYSWAGHLQDARHTQDPAEDLLLGVYNRFLKQKRTRRKQTPAWARELRELIQDHIDTSLSLSLKEVSRSLNVHPAYLSREFSRHFDDLRFGDYIRKLRIDKALRLLAEGGHSLSEIAYLTGFSDQSHFTRVFRKRMGTSPSAYRKSLAKGKTRTKR